MSSEYEFKQLYYKLSPADKALYLRSYNEAIAPIADSISAEEKHELCIYLIKKMKQAKGKS